MVFTTEDGILIKVLRQSKGYSARKLLEEFPDKDWSCSALSSQVKSSQSLIRMSIAHVYKSKNRHRIKK